MRRLAIVCAFGALLTSGATAQNVDFAKWAGMHLAWLTCNPEAKLSIIAVGRTRKEAEQRAWRTAKATFRSKNARCAFLSIKSRLEGAY